METETNINQLKELVLVLENAEQTYCNLSEMFKTAKEHHDKSAEHRFNMWIKVDEKLIDISHIVPAAVFESMLKLNRDSTEHIKKKIHDELHPTQPPQVQKNERYGGI